MIDFLFSRGFIAPKVAGDMEQDFKELSIGVARFTSDVYMFDLISAVRDTLQEAQLLIADDQALSDERNEVYKAVVGEGPHSVYHLPYGQTYGEKANVIAGRCYRPYLLMAADYFDFRPLSVRMGIKTLINRLEANPDFSIAGGRVNNRVQEYWLDDRGETVTKYQVPDRGALAYSCIECDAVFGFCLIRREVFKRVHWDESKDGDDLRFFRDVKRNGFKTLFVPGVNITLRGEGNEN